MAFIYAGSDLTFFYTPEDGGNVCSSPLMELFAAALCENSPAIYVQGGIVGGRGVSVFAFLMNHLFSCQSLTLFRSSTEKYLFEYWFQEKQYPNSDFCLVPGTFFLPYRIRIFTF